MTPEKLKAEALLQKLISKHQLVTYKQAFALIVGPPPNKWQREDSYKIVLIARTTKQVTVGGIAIQLDALIVEKRTCRPSESHFEHQAYTRNDWEMVFREWQMCQTATNLEEGT